MFKSSAGSLALPSKYLQTVFPVTYHPALLAPPLSLACVDAEHLGWIPCGWSHNSCSRRQLGAAGILKTELSVSPHLLITPLPHPAVLRIKPQLPALAGGRPSPRPGPFSFCCASPYCPPAHQVTQVPQLKSPSSPGDFVPVVPSTWDVLSRISA